MQDKGRRTLIGVIAVVIIVVALVVIGLQLGKQQKEKENLLPTQRPSWFGGGAGTQGGASAPTTSGQ